MTVPLHQRLANRLRQRDPHAEVHLARGLATVRTRSDPRCPVALARLASDAARLVAASLQSDGPSARAAVVQALSVSPVHRRGPAAAGALPVVVQALAVSARDGCVVVRVAVEDDRGDTLAHGSVLAALSGPPLADPPAAVQAPPPPPSRWPCALGQLPLN